MTFDEFMTKHFGKCCLWKAALMGVSINLLWAGVLFAVIICVTR